MSEIHFIPLQEKHFPFLVTWLNNSHVSQWWDTDEAPWNLKKVTKKYATNIHGYTIWDGQKKPLHCFIVCFQNKQIGYIQYYAVKDYPHAHHKELSLSANSAGIDFFIGDASSLGKGLGATMMNQFLITFIWPEFDTCIADPSPKNSHAIRTLEKSGFKLVKVIDNTAWMITKK